MRKVLVAVLALTLLVGCDDRKEVHCKDGTMSYGVNHTKACRHHGGVAR